MSDYIKHLLDSAMADIEIYSGEQSNIRRGQRPEAELDIILARLNKSISAIAESNKCFIMQLSVGWIGGKIDRKIWFSIALLIK